ncbi:MAG TPA: SpoIIE family protein phosphatase [Candidatus Limnocylindrales bacterium]|nr:SpoIIE family protein phosphatase [Candidatus Limnocylindrales bacterium]
MNGEGQYLVVRQGAADGERVPLDPVVPGTIGRSRENIVVLTDASISRQHARVSFKDGAWWVEDLGSKNGTKVNGRRIDAASRLTAGDVLQLGNFQIIFSASGSRATARVADIAGPAMLKSLPVEEFDTGAGTAPDTRSFGVGLSRERIGTFLRAVDKVGQALLAHRSVDELFAFVVELASDILRADRTVLLLKDPVSGELVSRAVKQGPGFEGGEIVVSRSIASAAMEQKQALLTGDAQSDTRFRAQQSVIQQRIHSAMCAPLWHDDQVLGLIYVDNVAAPAPFEEGDLRLLTLIAHLTAVKVRETEQYEAVERAARLDVELRRAATLQQNLLPPEPLHHGRAVVAGRNIPSFDVGGDYFDFIPSEDGRLVVALGDVAGKGMGAALLMTHLHATVRAQVETGRTLRDVMGRLNRSIHQNVRGLRFITLFLAQMDTESGAVTYVNGGHNPPFLVRASGEVESLTSGGLLLGMFPDATYDEGTAAMGPGDLLVAYSDGVTEARAPAAPGEEMGEDLGEERLIELLRSSRTLSPEELVERLIARVREFSGIAQQADDVTVAVIRFGS